MIRKCNDADIPGIMGIWLKSTIEAHKFIPEEYWLKNYSLVKDTYIPASKTFVYEENGQAKGFISIIDDTYIGALFVDMNYQGKGAGTALIEFAKKSYMKLSLSVYTENQNAVRFYRKSGFTVDTERINEDSGAKEFIMSWSMQIGIPV